LRQAPLAYRDSPANLNPHQLEVETPFVPRLAPPHQKHNIPASDFHRFPWRNPMTRSVGSDPIPNVATVQQHRVASVASGLQAGLHLAVGQHAFHMPAEPFTLSVSPLRSFAITKRSSPSGVSSRLQFTLLACACAWAASFSPFLLQAETPINTP
jgi:hypothetical protein